MSETIDISERLKALAGMVTAGNRVVDVGCDHGFLSIYLYEKGISKKLLAMDVRTGPLDGAKKHISERGLSEVIDTRLSDGLIEYNIGEAEAMVCAGMGGPLMCKIISDSFEKVNTLKELILQPQSELKEFREFLRDKDICIVDEEMIYEEGKYYFLMKAVPKTKVVFAEDEPVELYMLFGEKLIKKKDPILKKYLNERSENIGNIIVGLKDNQSENSKAAYIRLSEELGYIVKALSML